MSALVVLSLGEGNLTPAAVVQAVSFIRSLPFGRRPPDLPGRDVVAAACVNDSDSDAAETRRGPAAREGRRHVVLSPRADVWVRH